MTSRPLRPCARAPGPSCGPARPAPTVPEAARLHAPRCTAYPRGGRPASRWGGGQKPYLHSVQSVAAQVRAEVVEPVAVRVRGPVRQGSAPAPVVLMSSRNPGQGTTGRGPEAEVILAGLPGRPTGLLRDLDDLAQLLGDPAPLPVRQSALPLPAVGDRRPRARRPSARRCISSSVSHVTATPKGLSSQSITYARRRAWCSFHPENRPER